MTRFDYIRSAPPAFVEYLHPARLPEPLRTPLAALCTVALILCSWYFVEASQVYQAELELQEQKSRAIASRADLAQTAVRRTKLNAVMALDARVRGIRRSGAVLAHDVADLANHVPQDAWLTSISRADDGLDIAGDAVGLDGLSATLAALFTTPGARALTLVRAGHDERAGSQNVISFQVHANRTSP